MKTLLLITNCILLVIALPVTLEASFPQSHSCGDKVKGLSISTGDSGTLGPRGNPAGNPSDCQVDTSSGALSAPPTGTGVNHPHHNQPADNETTGNTPPYKFGRTRSGKDVTLELGLPKMLPPLDKLPTGWRAWNINILKEIAWDISQRFQTIVREVRDDKKKIDRATSILCHRKPYPPRPTKEIPILEVPSTEPSKEELGEMIHEYHTRLRMDMDQRNRGLKLLSNVARSRNNTDPRPDVPLNVLWNVNTPEQNVYITYWRTNQIQLLKEDSGDTPYSFTKVMSGDDVVEGIGLPKEIPNIAQLPQGWDQWHTATLRDVTMDITSRYDAIIKEVMDDRNEVERALRYVCGRTKRLGPQRQKSAINVVRPVPAQTSKHHDADLIKVIQNARNQLQRKVTARNTILRVLSKIPRSKNILDPGPDVPNVYVNYWRNGEIKLSPEAKSQGSKPDGDRASGSGGTSNVLPSTNKRPWDAVDAQGTGASVCGSNQLMTPYYDITEEEALTEMLEETAAALQSHKDGGHSPEHSHWLTSGSVPWHFDGGLTHNVDVPSTSFPASNSQSDAATAPSDPRVGVWNPSSEVQKNEHLVSYFDYNEWERGRIHKKGKHER